MMKIDLYIIAITFVLVQSCTSDLPLTLKAESLQLAINSQGHLQEILDLRSGDILQPRDTVAPLLSIQVDNRILAPDNMAYDINNQILILHYQGNISIKLKYNINSLYLTFEILGAQGHEEIELVVWGPYPLTLNKVIGETIGVVQGETFAVGLQSLNPKTLGGYPWNENDCMPQINIFEQDDYSDLSEENKSYVLYRVEAAKPASCGSSLQAYCRNRTEDRVVENWGHERYISPAYDDGGITGSKIALFGCPVDRVLETIGAIEVAEGLPHPMIDGEWGKLSKEASSAYIILDFSEDDIDRAIETVRRSGLKYLYHFNAFKTWGHFDLDERFFPNGMDGLKYCVEKAEREGIHVGVHMLSNFITTNDAYVTPVPDKRLARVGASTLIQPVDEAQTDIPVEDPAFFNQFGNNSLRTVMIGDELVQYDTVSGEAPWHLLGCTRGAFGTRARAHETGDTVSLLADHAYKVFLTDMDLGKEVARNMAAIFNYCGLRQISFDGLEGNRATGMGNYGEVLFTTEWYDHIKDDIRHHYIADASRTDHYFWHIYTRMNWGEPWYAGFRESQTDYRIKNQDYFRRNLMPAMLGWFRMTAGTTVADIEWLLARSAAYDAGYAFVTSYRALDENPHSDEILHLLGMWEEARMSGAFTDKEKERMKDLDREFHLEHSGEGKWVLTEQ